MSSEAQARLAFVSTMFLQPEDTGGRIRSCNTLRGMKGGRFDVTLLAPADTAQQVRYSAETRALCDRFIPLPAIRQPPRWRRAMNLFSSLPVSVASSISRNARLAVNRQLAEQAYDVVVFDFVHAAPLLPQGLSAATVCFTHNVETEIFDRHAYQASSFLMRRVWAHEARKMRVYERDALARFDTVIAVSERDVGIFARDFGRADVEAIPTGVDLDFFSFSMPPPATSAHGGKVVFTGSMDWAANADGLKFFIAEVWPLVLAKRPAARFEAVGRNPPQALLSLAASTRGVNFTGRVEDVRPHVRESQVFVIPLRVGGGTRIKAFEAMAMGCPMVSTTLGVEGLEVVDGEHLLVRDDAKGLAHAVLTLLEQPDEAALQAERARSLVQSRFSYRTAASAFEEICWRAHLHRGARARSLR